MAKKKISHRFNQNNTTTNPSAPELNTRNFQQVKTRSPHSTVVECWTRHPEVPSSNPAGAKKKISHRSNRNNSTTYPSAPELIPEIVRGENQKLPCSVVQCRTRDPEVPSSNPGVAKKKISHRSNQTNTTTNPAAPELNT